MCKYLSGPTQTHPHCTDPTHLTTPSAPHVPPTPHPPRAPAHPCYPPPPAPRLALPAALRRPAHSTPPPPARPVREQAAIDTRACIDLGVVDAGNTYAHAAFFFGLFFAAN